MMSRGNEEASKIRALLSRTVLVAMMVSLTMTTAFADTEGSDENTENGAPVLQEEVLTTETTEDTDAEGSDENAESDAPVQQEDVLTTETTEAHATEATVENTETAEDAQNDEEPKNSWYTINGKKYYAGKDGAVYKNGAYTIGGARYYFDANGVMKTGIIKVSGKVKYIARTNGKFYTGLFTYNNKKYYADKNGNITRNKLITVNKAKYYMSDSGAARTGYIKINTSTRYIANAKTAKIQTGWINLKGKKYYAKSNGVLVRNKMQTINKKKYYFDGNGVMLKSTTKTMGGYKYTFNKNGVMTKRVPTGATVAKKALSYRGTRYVWGCSNPSRGLDCSGLITASYRQCGIYVPHSSAAQRYSGRAVSANNLQAGDVVCWRGHVAMYIGNGQVVHAVGPGRRVSVASLSVLTRYALGRPISYRRFV